MGEEWIGSILFFGLSSYIFFSMHRKDKERNQDAVDINYGRFKIKVIMATMAFVSFFVILFKIYRYIKY